MAKHRCGNSLYEGLTQVETAGQGFFMIGLALAQASIAAQAELMAVYNRICPDRCDDIKQGLACYLMASIRAVDVDQPGVPGGRIPGYAIAIRWRLVVTCGKSEVQRNDPNPTLFGWNELEGHLPAVIGEDWKSKTIIIP